MYDIEKEESIVEIVEDELFNNKELLLEKNLIENIEMSVLNQKKINCIGL